MLLPTFCSSVKIMLVCCCIFISGDVELCEQIFQAKKKRKTKKRKTNNLRKTNERVTFICATKSLLHNLKPRPPLSPSEQVDVVMSNGPICCALSSNWCVNMMYSLGAASKSEYNASGTWKTFCKMIKSRRCEMT